uniref:Thioredoxin (TrxA) n=5 Tax=environmental samples TaxID=68359 RepID=A0A075HYL2_9EURY|nr:thioredoxin (trxA) [uncultured marine group II/III euryarchaeote AD1000_24_F05]AIF04304.1 thioredoxin (trxA) [uncultured marine group II/III euryarchaeote KM3_173_A11]AIF18893.1 thioredoxin (trxA) [uncultured marine group II/III euryarchaeote KM3_84_G11]MBC8517868.1 thioredoxin [Euryarchaeota archaeon]
MAGAIVEASDATFDTVTTENEWVLVDFWAPWCGPCKMIAPVLEQIADERDNLTIAKVNVDHNQNSPGRFGVRGIPTLVLFHNGEPIDQHSGAMQKGGFDDWLNRHMN